MPSNEIGRRAHVLFSWVTALGMKPTTESTTRWADLRLEVFFTPIEEP